MARLYKIKFYQNNGTKYVIHLVYYFEIFFGYFLQLLYMYKFFFFYK